MFPILLVYQVPLVSTLQLKADHLERFHVLASAAYRGDVAALLHGTRFGVIQYLPCTSGTSTCGFTPKGDCEAVRIRALEVATVFPLAMSSVDLWCGNATHLPCSVVVV